jgi:hypothetical protein
VKSLLNQRSRVYTLLPPEKTKNLYVIVSLLDDLEPLVLVGRRVIVAHARELSLEKQTEGAARWHRGKVGKLVLHHHCDVEAARDWGQGADVADKKPLAKQVLRPEIVAVVQVENTLCAGRDDSAPETRCLQPCGLWFVVGGLWFVVGGWWLVVGGWWLVVGVFGY